MYKLNTLVWVAVNGKSKIASGCEGMILSDSLKYMWKKFDVWYDSRTGWRAVQIQLCPKKEASP